MNSAALTAAWAFFVLAFPSGACSQAPKKYEGQTIKQWLQQLDDEKLQKRNDAEAALGRVGRDAVKPLIDLLIQHDQYHWLTIERAERAIGRIGPDAVGPLIQALRHPSKYVRRSAARALQYIGPDAASAVPQLTRSLSDESEDVQMIASFALGHIGEKAKPAVPAMLKCALSLKGPENKLNALAGIKQLGPIAIDAAPGLIAVVKDKKADLYLRSNAAITLTLLRADSKSVVPA